MTESDLSKYCSCETVALGELGVIEPEELVSRVVCDPRHVYKKDGSIKPGVFPPSHIKEKGLSLMRSKHLSDDELRMHSDAIASHSEKDVAVGVIEGKVQSIREMEEVDRTRSVCLFDDPVKDDSFVPENPAHALLIAAKEMGDDDIAEIRTLLLTKVFGELRRFEA